MQESKLVKYLGDFLSYNEEDSVYQTVMKRAPVVRHVIHEIRTVIEDLRSERLGALSIAFAL